VSKWYGEWYQKTNKTEDTNKLNLLAFKIIAILHNTPLAMFLKLLETVSKGILCYYVCGSVLHARVAALLARSQYLEHPATSHLGTGVSWFPHI
jgi:hypothetical protein